MEKSPKSGNLSDDEVFLQTQQGKGEVSLQRVTPFTPQKPLQVCNLPFGKVTAIMRVSDVIVGKERKKKGPEKCLRIGGRLVNYIHVRRKEM